MPEMVLQVAGTFAGAFIAAKLALRQHQGALGEDLRVTWYRDTLNLLHELHRKTVTALAKVPDTDDDAPGTSLGDINDLLDQFDELRRRYIEAPLYGDPSTAGVIMWVMDHMLLLRPGKDETWPPRILSSVPVNFPDSVREQFEALADALEEAIRVLSDQLGRPLGLAKRRTWMQRVRNWLRDDYDAFRARRG